MSDDIVAWDDPRSIKRAITTARRLPADLRNAMKTEVNRKVVAPLAREVQAVAGKSAITPVRAFRNRGVFVKPGEKPVLVVGGPEPYGRTTMKTIAGGAEWGGSNRHTTYQRKGRKVGRKRGAPHSVTRRTTREFGKRSVDGRFVYPTFKRMWPVIQDQYLAILQKVVSESAERPQ